MRQLWFAGTGEVFSRGYQNNTWSNWEPLSERPETIYVTLNNETVQSWDIQLRKCGRLMTINGWFRLNEGKQGNVATLPVGSRPGFPIRTACAVAEQAYMAPIGMGYMIFDNNGTVNVTCPSNRTSTTNAVYLSCSYAIEG